jgi:hypothetical protein
MRKHLCIYLVILCPIFAFSQNVGIGVLSPSAKLEVEGDIKADSLDLQSGLIKNVADPISAQDAATKAYVDLLESTVELLEARLALLTNAPIAEDDNINFTINAPVDVDVLDYGTPDNDPDGAFRYGNFIEITNVGSSPGSNDNLSKKGRALSINNNGTAEDKTDDFVVYTPDSLEIDSFYYVISDLDNLKDTALVVLNGVGNVQQRLDNGETPIEIYNSDNSLLDSLYGKTYQEGLITYLDTITGTGLVAAPFDQSYGDTPWGCNEEIIGGTSSDIGTGQANTTLIVDGCAESGIAARLCDDLVIGIYDDWFLPSKDELNEIFINLKLNGYGGDLGIFGPYWSSTETAGGDNAWIQNLSNGVFESTYKEFLYVVRAVRAF